MELAEILIGEELTIIEAMERLDRIARKVLFIQKDDKLVASVTDGDIRRFILGQGDLKAFIKEAANYKPKYLFSTEYNKAKAFMKANDIEALPIIGEDYRIESVVFSDDKEIVRYKDKIDIPVIMMAGGFGTRLYPYTQILPKPLIPVGELPIAEHIINQFHEAGCNAFYLIVNHKKNMIKAYFNEVKKAYTISYADEETPLGTGGGLSLLKGKFEGTCLLTNCDILIQHDISKVLKFHREQKNMITMICSLKKISIPYGVVEIGENGEIGEMNEKPQLSFLTNTGCYFLESEVINDLEEGVSIGFPDIIKKYKELGRKVGIYPISENAWLDMGEIDELERMRKILGNS